MGMNAKAIAAFGIGLGEDLPASLRSSDDEEDSFDFEEYVAEVSGLKRPETNDYNDQAWSNYWEAKRKAVAEFPATLIRTGSFDYSSWIIAVNGTEQTAEWGDAKPLNARSITVDEMSGFQDFCAKHDIDGEPAWLLAAFYG